MCPDRQILSLYVDGELPSPWKEKIESHLASCEDCRTRLDRYNGLHSVLLESSQSQNDAMKDAQERVWEKLGGGRARKAHRAVPFSLVPAGWRRSVSLPVPAAAAAAAIFVVAALLAARGFITPSQPRPNEQMASIGIGADLQGIVPMSNMDEILQYLSSQEAGGYMIIQLPESRNFSSFGEPALIRAADYSGRTGRELRAGGPPGGQSRHRFGEAQLPPSENANL